MKIIPYYCSKQHVREFRIGKSMLALMLHTALLQSSNPRCIAISAPRSARRLGGTIPLFVAAISASLSCANAQEAPVEKKLIVRPSAELTYDSNVFRVTDNGAQPADDLIFSPGVAVDFTQPLSRHTLKLHADGYYDIYTQNSTRNRARINLSADGIYRIGRACQAQFTGAFRRQRSDFGDINGAIENLQSTSIVGAEFSCPYAAGFYPVGAIRRTTSDNSERYQFADQTTLIYRGGVGFTTPSLGTVTAYYQHDDTDRPILSLKNRVDRAGLTFERAIVSHASVEVDVHWLKLRSTNPAVPDYDNPGWKVDLTVSPIPTVLSFKGRLARTIVNDSLVPAGYAVVNLYAGTAQWLLSDRTALDLGVEYSDRVYRRDPVLLVSSINDDTVLLYTGALRRKVGRGLEVYVRGQRAIRSTDSGIAEYSVTTGSIGVSAEF